MNGTRTNNTHFIGILVPEELEDVVADCRAWMQQQYGCKSGYGTPAHITLVAPFTLPEKYGVSQLKAAIAEGVADCAEQGQLPFAARVNGFGAFSERTLFAHVEDSSAWQQVHSAIFHSCATALPGMLPPSKRRYVPHLTVANRDIPTGAIDRALSHFSELNLDISFDACDVALFVRTQRGGWTIGDVFGGDSCR